MATTLCVWIFILKKEQALRPYCRQTLLESGQTLEASPFFEYPESDMPYFPSRNENEDNEEWRRYFRPYVSETEADQIYLQSGCP